MLSAQPAVVKAVHDPQLYWFLGGVTAPFYRQSKDYGTANFGFISGSGEETTFYSTYKFNISSIDNKNTCQLFISPIGEIINPRYVTSDSPKILDFLLVNFLSENILHIIIVFLELSNILSKGWIFLECGYRGKETDKHNENNHFYNYIFLYQT